MKYENYENDLIIGMQRGLTKLAFDEQPNLVKAGECLHAALEIFERAGMTKQADAVLQLMQKIAEDQNDATKKQVSKAPNTKQQIKNLKEFGTPCNMHADDLELADDELFVFDDAEGFENE
jgi:hypothetical protein